MNIPKFCGPMSASRADSASSHPATFPRSQGKLELWTYSRRHCCGGLSPLGRDIHLQWLRSLTVSVPNRTRHHQHHPRAPACSNPHPLQRPQAEACSAQHPLEVACLAQHHKRNPSVQRQPPAAVCSVQSLRRPRQPSSHRTACSRPQRTSSRSRTSSNSSNKAMLRYSGTTYCPAAEYRNLERLSMPSTPPHCPRSPPTFAHCWTKTRKDRRKTTWEHLVHCHSYSLA